MRRKVLLIVNDLLPELDRVLGSAQTSVRDNRAIAIGIGGSDCGEIARKVGLFLAADPSVNLFMIMDRVLGPKGTSEGDLIATTVNIKMRESKKTFGESRIRFYTADNKGVPFPCLSQEDSSLREEIRTFLSDKSAEAVPEPPGPTDTADVESVLLHALANLRLWLQCLRGSEKTSDVGQQRDRHAEYIEAVLKEWPPDKLGMKCAETAVAVVGYLKAGREGTVGQEWIVNADKAVRELFEKKGSE
jgi:hypothetical protein